MKDWDKLRPAQRAKLSKELMQMLVNKMKTMPGSPGESLANVNEARTILEQLEGKKGQTNENKEVMVPLTFKPPK